MVTVIKGNVREVPDSIPVGVWWDKINEYQDSGAAVALPWYMPEMEYLTPDELARTRAKGLVWLEVTGSLPVDVSCWWEIRQARKRGDIPASDEWTTALIDEGGILHCGHCNARWSPSDDGSPHADRCGLCGFKLAVIDDRRETQAEQSPAAKK